MQEQSLYIGWDVGAWNCDRNKASRDAVVVVSDSENGGLQFCGGVAALNLRPELNTCLGSALIDGFLRRCSVLSCLPVRVIAVDTPLGWPLPMRRLLSAGITTRIPENADENPYLFRQTELDLFKRLNRPLSAVRDMIGSQSIKGIHFLAALGATTSRVGVWEYSAPQTPLPVSIIETYPAPCKSARIICNMVDDIARQALTRECMLRYQRFAEDLDDALRCAAIAWLYANHPETLRSPPADTPQGEGWIWLPNQGS
jgi:hypothetical protein